MILDEELKPISPQEAKDKAFFGPVYHGSTTDKLDKINTQGFKITVGHERSGDVSHGYEAGAYGSFSIPAPIHHLGFGVYFTTSKTIAKKFGYGNTKIGPYFLDMPRMTTINWGSPNTMMKWWIENGYDYKKTPETTYGSGKTDLYAIRQERMRATIHLTETLKSKYDGVWYKGKGLYRLLDGDQVVVFDPNNVYKLDKTLVKPGEIGSKVVAKVGIDPYGHGEIKVPIGTRGVIIDKKKPTEYQKWAEGSEFLYAVKFEIGGVLYDLIDKWIEPYQRAKLKESIIQRRSFWKDYENLVKETKTDKIHENYLPISKEEEYRVIDYIIREWKNSVGSSFGKHFKKIKHIKGKTLGPGIPFDVIDYVYDFGNEIRYFCIRKTSQGVGFYEKDDAGYQLSKFKMVIPSKPPEPTTELKEDIEKEYSPITKFEEQEALQRVILNLKTRGVNVKDFRKISERNKLITYYPKECQIHDEREYEFIRNDENKIFVIIRKIRDKFSYITFSSYQRLEYDRIPRVFTFTPVYGQSADLEENNQKRGNEYKKENWREGDEDHAQALQQTGYWGRQGAGAIILAKDTGRILLPLRSRLVEQPNTWGVWGGAIDEEEDPASAVRRELSEEVGYNLQIDELIPMYVFEDPRVGFKYSNFLAVVPTEFKPKLNWETQNFMWIEFGKWLAPLHFGLKSLLQHSGKQILQEVQKYKKDQPKPKNPKEDKEKYNAAMEVIRRVWSDMYRGGDYKNRFDYGNSFVHWMLNSEDIHNNLLTKYGKQFYPDAVEPHYAFSDYIEKILELLEQKYYTRITRKVDKNDPLYYLKQTVKGNTWNKSKQNLKKLISGTYVLEQMPDDIAEGIFNRLYKSAMGETFYDASKMKFTTRLDKMAIGSDSSTKAFIQHYTPKGLDRFPDKVKVWRGLHTPTSKIRPGDFVTFDNAYARAYVSGGKHGAVVSDILPTKDLLVFKPDIDHSELIYWPEGHQIKHYTGHIPTFKEFYLQYK